MTFKLRQLDNLTYDEVEPLLEDYILGAIDEFLASEIGQTYQRSHPDAGDWIYTFIEMAYRYEEMTLPKMTQRDAQIVMEVILPRKLMLMEPSEAADAIPELVAFWTFLKATYKLRSAGAIAKYLQSIEGEFSRLMLDPARSGIAKSFMMQGVEAGYDMTNQDEVTAFQALYNQQIENQPPALPNLPSVPLGAPPSEMKMLFEAMGVPLPAPGQLVNPAMLFSQLLNAASSDPAALAIFEEFLATLAGEEDELAAPPAVPDIAAEQRELRMMVLETLPQPQALSESEQALLKAQAIAETEPGTILQDFQTVLEFVGADGVAVSGKRHQFPLKQLAALNERLSQPIELALKRPQQKSYPPIHGLYMLLRATGIVKLVATGKQQRLVLNAEIYDQWQQLNPTERYCTLLEAWLVRADAEMLGESQGGPFGEGDRCLKSWQELGAQSKHTYKNYGEQQRLDYWPGLHNVALMSLFGLLKLTPGKPTAGKGWRIQKIAPQPFGHALMAAVQNTYFANQLVWQSDANPNLPFNELQPTLSPYFPDWQQALQLPQVPFRAGRYIFKVNLGKIWRRLAISGEATLADLSNLILTSVEFDSDHLDQYTYIDEFGRKIEVVHPYAQMGDRKTTEVKIGSLPLNKGSTMEYLFDFGDCWEFTVQLEAIEPAPQLITGQGYQKVKPSKARRSRHAAGEILEARGKAPCQYPDFDAGW